MYTTATECCGKSEVKCRPRVVVKEVVDLLWVDLSRLRCMFDNIYLI